jgi:hypothetical protein
MLVFREDIYANKEREIDSIGSYLTCYLDGVSLNDPDIDDEYLTEVLQDLQEIEAK